MSARRPMNVRQLVYAALCLALALILPLLTGNIPHVGRQFAPMHFPVLLCGFLAGPLWGGVVGVSAPILRYLIFGAPAIYPEAVQMMAELAVYGIAAGLFYRYLPKRPWGILASLISAQLFGRLAWGLMRFLLSLLDASLPFSPELVVTATVSSSLWGLLIQLLLIPPTVYAMQKARFIPKN